MCPEGWSRDEPTLDPTRVLSRGRMVGQYRIEAEIGSGTFGVVYRAHDTTLKRSVALKVFKPGPAATSQKFLEEARAAAALNHPNVCTIHSVDESDGISMIVMEHVDGRPLVEVLKAGKPPLEDAKNIARQIAHGMAAAHAQNIVHGDLKPANIMVTPDGTAKIMDFGLAHRGRTPRAADETASWGTGEPGGLSGTPAYMSPELVRGEPAGTASDVFSLALVLYEMASGRQAIQGDNLLDVMRAIDTLDSERYAAELSEPLSTIVRRALASDWHQRDITMSEVAQLLSANDQPIATT
jgi:serine/threonine protein kinase